MKKTTHLDEAQALEEYKALYSFYNLYPIKQGYREDSRFSPFWKETLEQNSILQNIDNSMIQDGVFCFSTDSASRRYYIDTHSGLIFIIDGKTCYVNTYGEHTSPQYDIFEAAFHRRFIQDASFRNKMNAKPLFSDMTALNYLGREVRDLFSVPIIDYTVSSKKELDEILDSLKAILSESIFYKKIWFRGQRKEYSVSRTEKTIDTLNLPNEYQTMPLLSPSISRHIGDETGYSRIAESKSRWISAFGVWLLSQSKEFPFMAIGEPDYYNVLKNLELEKMLKFIDEYPYDIADYISNVDTNNNLAYVLAIQQYGGLTTMLDVTDDIDVAIFFTQSKLNKATNRFELCDPTHENIIYVFAQCADTSTYDISRNLFSQLSFNGIFTGDYSIPARINNQRCGLLYGASLFEFNTYSYRIIAKIHLRSSDITTTKTVEEMFPSQEMDSLFKTFSNVIPGLEGLYG